MNCVHCSKETGFEKGSKLSRRDQCPHCAADLRSCVNCEFYSPGSQWDCREHISEVVREKDKANFCDYFSYDPTQGAASSSKNDALAQAEALFKKKS